MKRFVYFMSVVVALFLCCTFSSCENDVGVADDGSNPRLDEVNLLFHMKSADVYLDYENWTDWSANYSMVQGDDGAYLRINKAGAWSGGVIYSATGKYFNLSKVSKITLQFRSNIDPSIVDSGGIGLSNGDWKFSASDFPSYSATDWTVITLPISATSSRTILGFTIGGEEPYGSWFEIKDIRLYDYGDNEVPLTTQ